jgi:hypothetical protein
MRRFIFLRFHAATEARLAAPQSAAIAKKASLSAILERISFGSPSAL